MPQAAIVFVAKALVAVGVKVGIAKAIAVVAVKLAINLAVSAAASALQSPQDPGRNLLDPAAYSQLGADPLSERIIGYGETGIAGEVVFQQVTADKKGVNYVISLLDAGQVAPHEWVKTLIDGDEVTFDALDNGNAVGTYEDHLWVRFYGGTPTQTADATLISESGGLWSADHRGKSCAYAIMKAKIADQEKFPNGRPNPIFVMKCRRVYDPRKDSTKPGGVGAHRIDDESTWEWSDNLALCAYDYARGVWVVGDDAIPRRVAGLGLPISLIDESWVVASANVCEEMGWTCNGLISAGSDPADVLKSMAVHMCGRMATRKGKFAPIAGYDWPSTLEITENDLAGKLKVRHAKKWREVHNTIKAAYRDGADANFEGVETNPVKVAAWVTQDNGQAFERTISLPFTHDRALATRLAKFDLYRKRAPRVIEVPVKLKKGRALEGDIVDVNLPSYDLAETYEVTSWTLDQAGFVMLTLELWNPAGLDWAVGEEGDPPVYGSLERQNLAPETPADADWSVTASTYKDFAPAIDIVGAAPDWIHAVVIEWRETGDTAWTMWGEADPGASVKILGLAPLTAYEFSIRYRFGVRYSPARLIKAATTLSELRAYMADAIEGQGALATLSAVDGAHLSAGVGKNCLIDDEFRFSTTYWRATPQSGSVVRSTNSTGGLRRETLTGSGVTIGHYIQLDSYPQRLSFPILAGEWAEGYAYLGGSNVSKVTCAIQFYDAAGATTGFSAIVDDTSPSAGGGEITTFEQVGVIAQAPANTVRAILFVRGTASSAAPVLHVTRVYLGKAQSGQTQFTPWNRGFDGEPGANVTETRTAAAITGQGSLATANQVNLGASGRVYRDDGVTRLTDALAVTSLGTAAAITGQGAGATANSLSALDSTAAAQLAALNAGTATPGGGKANNASVVVSASATWVTVAQVDVVIPRGGFVCFPFVYAGFTADAVNYTAGIRILETDTSDVGTTVHVSATAPILAGGDPVIEWDAPSAWSDKFTPDTDSATRRFKLQVNRNAGSGTVAIAAGAAQMGASLW